MNTVLQALFGLLIGILVCVLLSFLYWLIGFILYQFNFSRFLGFKFMAMSGLFCKFLPKYCPYSRCIGTSCRIWNCPHYSKKDSSC